MSDVDDFIDEFDTDFYDEEERPADNLSNENIDPSYLECLKTKFGHSGFRPTQWKVISSVLEERRDNCIVMATGYGKSLCYQFPSVYLNTVTLVVSPLISLMEDQVLSLSVSNISACLLGSAQRDKDILHDVLNFEYNLVYVTPEYITGDSGAYMLRKLLPKLTLIAIDEAHCISKWGHDFRTAYRRLDIRASCPNVPILAMTATATVDVREDISRSLKLRNPQILCTGFDRPNLEFNVRLKGSQGVWADIGPIIRTIHVGSIIIYCLSRNQTEDTAVALQRAGVECEPYHAGLSIANRRKVHENFVRDKIRIIVATIAFGMGIDKPDVRIVIHYGVSKDIESYYQEVGRAGRDGLPSKCFMFYSRADWVIHQALRQKSGFTHAVQEHLEKLSSKMSEYVQSVKCRREFILNYFEGSTENRSHPKNCCDNCKSNFSSSLSTRYEGLDDNNQFDFTKDSEILLSAIEALNGRFGIKMPILLLRGSKNQSLNKKYYTHPAYGTGKKSEDWYKSLSDILLQNNYLQKHSAQSFYQKNAFASQTIISLTDLGKGWLYREPKKVLKFQPLKDMYKFMQLKRQSDTSKFLHSGPSIVAKQGTSSGQIVVAKQTDMVQDLLKALYNIRSNLASTLEIMPYMIASNKALHQMAQKQPVNLDELKNLKVDGFSDVKVAKFGPALIKCILQAKNFLPPDASTAKSGPMDIKDALASMPLPNAKLTETHLKTYDLWKAGKTSMEIAQSRGLSQSTVNGYLSELIKSGLISSKSELRRLGLPDCNFDIIKRVLPEDLTNVKLSVIKELCPPTITFDMIKYVINYLQIRKHLQMNNIEFVDPDRNSFAKNENKINEIKEIPSSSKQEEEIKDEIEFTKCIDWESDEELFSETVQIPTNDLSVEESNELTMLIADIERDELKKKEDKPKLVINMKNSTQLAYDDDDSSSSDENTKPRNNVKRALPTWLSSSQIKGNGPKKVKR